MKFDEIRKLAYGTADPAYVLDPEGMIASWNSAAAELFGLDEQDVIGKPCHATLQGVDECGRQCDQECNILKRANEQHPLRNYDIQVTANGKKQWCNVSVVILEDAKSIHPYTLHIVRPTDIQKRLEMVMRDFASENVGSSPAQIEGGELRRNSTSPSREVDLTRREIEVLKRLSEGSTTSDIAEALFVSKTTVNNHVQHILKKLSVHSRLEAIRVAEKAGLIRRS